MTDGGEARVRAAFAEQGRWCEEMGSPFTARLCAVLGDKLDQSSEVGRRVLGWRGDPGGWADGLPLRLCGGLHALVRSDRVPELERLYPPHPLPGKTELSAGLVAALASEEASLLPWLDSPLIRAPARPTSLVCGGLSSQGSREASSDARAAAKPAESSVSPGNG